MEESGVEELVREGRGESEQGLNACIVIRKSSKP